MRQSQKNNRARNKNNRKPSGYSPNRVYESSGPEGKVRGTPQQIIEKYQSLARDKATAGDRVMAESFLQHAEHYMRILTAAQPRREERDEREEDTAAETEGEARAEVKADGAADPLAVIGDDDGPGELVSAPEGGGRPRRRRDNGDASEEPRRPRRPRRRERPEEGEERRAEPAESASGDASEPHGESADQPLSAAG